MTDQQETTTISVSEYESAGSLSNGLVKNVKIAPRSVERFEKTCDSLSLNSASFKIPISDNLLLSRRMILEMPVTLTVNAGAEHIRHYYACPRADALNRIITNCSVKVNGSSVVSRPSDFCEVVQFFSRESQHLHHGGLLSETANTPDIQFGWDVGDVAAQAYNGTQTPLTPDLRDNLRDYHWRTANYDLAYPSRAATCGFTKVGNTAADNTGDSVTSLTFVLRYALKNPVFSSSAYEVLSNIQDLEVNLTFNSAQFLQRLFYHPRIQQHTGLTELNPTASISTVAGDVKLIGFTINPAMPDMIPLSSLIPAQEIINFDYPVPGPTVAGADTAQIVHTSINVSQVPQMIFISCVPNDNSLSSKMSDYYAPIKDLTLQVNNRTFSFNLWRTFDFYEQNCRNQYKQTFKTFDSSGKKVGRFDARPSELGVGGPLCFTMNDIGGELRSGVMEQFKLEVRYTATNTTPRDMTFVSRVHLVMDQTIIIQKGSPCRVLNGISPEEFNQAVSEGKIVTLGSDDKDEQEYLMGGGISSMFRDGGRFLVRSLNTANQVVQTASQLYPEIPGRIPMELNRANQLAQNLNQNLNLGAGSMLGGSRLDVMRAAGILR